LFNNETHYKEDVVAITEVHCYVMSKDDFRSRLRPSIIQYVKSLSQLKKKWWAGRTDFLACNATCNTVFANIHKDNVQTLLPVADVPGRRSIDYLNNRKSVVETRRALKKLQRSNILAPVSSIKQPGPAIAQLFKKQEELTKKLTVSPPKRVPKV
jgi:hypothetical protein